VTSVYPVSQSCSSSITSGKIHSKSIQRSSSRTLRFAKNTLSDKWDEPPCPPLPLSHMYTGASVRLGGPGVGSGRTGICPPPGRGPMTTFPPVLGLYPSGFGGEQTRVGSGEGGSVPFGRLGGPGVGSGHAGIWPPPVRGPMPAFFPVLGLYPSGVGGGQTRTGSVE
jgi:hypothetical protein